MKASVNLLLLCMLLFTSISCVDWRERDENGDPIDVLPSKTAIGKNNLGFMMDDEVWVAQKGTTLGSTITTSMGQDYLYLTAKRRFERTNDEANEIIIFHLIDKSGEGYFGKTMPYKVNSVSDSLVVYWQDELMGCTSYVEAVLLNNVDFTLTTASTDGYIVASEFSMDVRINECDSFRISDGRFDVSFGN
ncbi:hypothetical protein QWY31_15965 [Cytophagales bacterium LB-30]|uniref:Uncharacterized protein n=1 Tax=Shiella aurantiaca TaxID=3058365 RepID=A0ABT8F946_9BACT|nr:hypothetical protein [Shiella aurantiaca]MDN4167008.1 hypothetical protein [Shiella aurantiaca]